MGTKTSAFGPYMLDRERRRLTRKGEPVPVGHRGYILLETLLDAGGEPVSKDVLMERAWPGTIIEESNLSVQISALRRLLGNGADGIRHYPQRAEGARRHGVPLRWRRVPGPVARARPAGRRRHRERVRQAIEAAAILHPAEPTGRKVVTVSVGAAAMVTDDGLNAAKLVAAVDAALYEAKRNGRNLVYPPLGGTSATLAAINDSNATEPPLSDSLPEAENIACCVRSRGLDRADLVSVLPD